MRHLAQILCAGSFLAACAQTDPAERIGFDPVTANPGDLRLAVALPDGVRLRDGTGTLTLSARRSDTGEASEAAYRLAQVQQDAWTVFAVRPADVLALAKQQALITGWQAEAPEATSGSLAVAVTACADGDIAPRPRVSVAGAAQPGAPLTVFVRDAPISAVLGEKAIGPCELSG